MRPTLRKIAVRRFIAMALVLLGAGVFTARLVDVQVLSAPQLNEDAKDKRAVPAVIPSIRGDILDRNGAVLATTDERYDVQLSPKNARLKGWFDRQLEDGTWVEVTTEQAFEEIAAITGQKAEEIAKIVDDAIEENPKSDFAYVKREVDLTSLNALKMLNIPWVTFAVNPQRSYPNGAVAGNLIGFAGSEGQAQAGIELSQDECLTGVDGEETYERGADGVRLPGSVIVTENAEDGGTVQLTIDRDLQYETQQAIDALVTSSRAEWGLLTVMEVETGELLAVAEDRSVDPNDVSASPPDRREARSFTSPYEPGSTFKTLTAAALVNQGAANAYSQFNTPWTIEPEPGVSFSDFFEHPEMPWTLTGILVRSSNVGISMLGSRLSPELRYEYLRSFGIGEATNAGMPVESGGILYGPGEWDRQTSYNTMFGQGLSSTIIQTASAYQAIANDGVRLPPKLVKGCAAADGTFAEFETGEPVRVIGTDAAAETRRMLEAVAQQDWLEDPLWIPGYRLGGKTATAQQSNGQGGYREDYVYSFAGMFPMDDPKYVIVSTVAFPKSGNGSVLAAQGWNAAAKATIRTFHVPPSEGRYDPLPETY